MKRLLPGLLMAFCAASAVADDARPAFEGAARRADTRIEFAPEGDRLVIHVRSSFGIDSATITRKGARWPASVVARLHLKGLESFRASAGGPTVEWSVSSTGRNVSRSALRKDGGEIPLRPDSPWFTKAVIAGGGAGRIPLGDGEFFEVALPVKLFEANPETITLRWIDFHR